MSNFIYALYGKFVNSSPQNHSLRSNEAKFLRTVTLDIIFEQLIILVDKFILFLYNLIRLFLKLIL